MDIDSKLFAYIIDFLKEKRYLYPKKSNHYAFAFRKNDLNLKNLLAFGSNFIPVKGNFKSIHAEHNVIFFVITLQRDIHILKKNESIDIVSIRMTLTGIIGNARPCEGCIIRMSKCPIKINNVFYSHDVNIFKKEKFRDMRTSTKNRFSLGDNRNTKCNTIRNV